VRGGERAASFAGLPNITVDPEILGGQPTIRGMRLSVRRLLEALSRRPNWGDLQADYPGITEEDVRQALVFAASMIDDRIVHLDRNSA
jgi:uncharacterized protein (DUF433 family)